MKEKIDAALVLFNKPKFGDRLFVDFRSCFDEYKIKNYSFDEITKKFKNAEKCDDAIPDRENWPMAMLNLTIDDKARDIAGSPVYGKYFFRSPMFNSVVGGEVGSDHLKFASDLVFRNFAIRDVVLTRFVFPLYETKLFYLSVGVGVNEPMIHIGCFCKDYQRAWEYQREGGTKPIKI